MASRRKTEKSWSNESVSQTLEIPIVTSSLDTEACSKSNSDNKFSKADKSWCIGQKLWTKNELER